MGFGLERAIAQALEDANPTFGVFETDIFITQEPKTPDDTITIFLDGGGPPISFVGEEQSITIRTRRGADLSSERALEDAKEIHTFLHQFQGNVRSIPIAQVTADFLPIPLGRDADTTRGGRFVVTQTFTVVTRRFAFTA